MDSMDLREAWCAAGITDAGAFFDALKELVTPGMVLDVEIAGPSTRHARDYLQKVATGDRPRKGDRWYQINITTGLLSDLARLSRDKDLHVDNLEIRVRDKAGIVLAYYDSFLKQAPVCISKSLPLTGIERFCQALKVAYSSGTDFFPALRDL